jgi:hypothetical protein
MCAFQGRRVARKEARQSDLLLVLPTHGMGQSFCQRRMGQDRKKEQNEGRNTYAALAAAATVGKSQWAHLLANMHHNLADE